MSRDGSSNPVRHLSPPWPGPQGQPLPIWQACISPYIKHLRGFWHEWGTSEPLHKAWTGEIHGRVVCDVCGDSSVGPEDHILEGAEVVVLCITNEVLNYQAFTNAKGIYTVAETMSESDRWDSCLARPVISFHEHCTHLGEGSTRVKFNYNHSSGCSHNIRPFVY
ncbi:uncharacterized protein LOC131173453 [Hevea brasiliensis]|uniref:uncharacterized protein LOC131173453 n=1 Tax=Hevea brasiliensis TaxID=3981 RepID=UPI0026003119|nr:uncharacterized protein LOC131173453 [Hevea brasiliensis]